jgi:hypothetical protein
VKRVWFVGALALAVALVAACDRPHVRAAAPEGANAWTSCSDALESAGAPVENLPLLDDGFAPISVVVCRSAQETNSSGGVDRVAYERRGANIDALVTALRVPDAPRTRGACTMEHPFVDWFALLDAGGRWVRPGVPIDLCGKVSANVEDAIRAMTWTDVYRIVPGRSAEFAASGCDQQATDRIWAETSTPSDRQWPTIGNSPFAKGVALRVCVYAVPASEQRKAKPAGTLVSGGAVTADFAEPFAYHFGQAGRAAPCDTPASRFALVRQWKDAGIGAYVELDGCRRVMVSSGGDAADLSLGQADDIILSLMDVS